MQRDVYAALIKKWHKKKLGINVLQLDGSITHELSFDDCFIGYRRRKLLLMTHNARSPYHRSSMAVGLREEVGEAATQSHYPRDVIISSFEQLLRHHTPDQLYQLLPLLCTNEEAFCALQGICDSPGSFFQLCHRVDPRNLTLRFNSGSPNRDGICSFFEGHFSPQEMTTPTSYRKLPISGIEFNGLMLVKGKFLRNPAPTVAGADACEPTPRMVSAAAFLTTHQQLTEISIIQRALTCDFFHSSAYNSIASRSDLLAEVQSTVTHMHFMAVKDIPNQVVSASGDARGAFSQRDRLLQMAREKKLFVYERRLDGSYHYAV